MRYERFTERAKKVLELAEDEARRLNHEYLGTEHVLLGLAKEGSGVGANVLRNLEVSLDKVRSEVEKIVQSGPEMFSMGTLPQTPRTKKVIERAMEEARSLGHNYVGTEHLLLGLLREDESVAARVLMNLGVDLETAREEVLNLLGAAPQQQQAARRSGKAQSEAGPAQASLGLLLWLLSRPDDPACQVLVGAGLNLEKAIAEVRARLGQRTG